MLTVKIMAREINIQGSSEDLMHLEFDDFMSLYEEIVKRQKPILSLFSKPEVLEVSVEQCHSRS